MLERWRDRLLRRPLVPAGIVAAILIVTGALWLRAVLFHDHFPPGREHRRVEIPSGSTLRGAAARLEDAGVLDAAWKIRLAARLRGGGRAIKAGSYDLEVGRAPMGLLMKLVAGEVITVRLTVPEGWTAAQVAELAADSLQIDRAAFLHRVREPLPRWVQALSLPAGATLEGYLFPETYRFAEGVGVDPVLDSMIGTFEQAMSDSLRRRAAERDMSLHQVVTLASIVEAEAQRPQERAKIAAVYENRLRRGWRLEADPTVAYALDKQGQRLSYGDLQIDSAYNTYRHDGLPPGPIDNPGRAAIVATLWPQPDFDALYFVADGHGGHVFSRTWEEHRRAVAAYRRALREERAAGPRSP